MHKLLLLPVLLLTGVLLGGCPNVTTSALQGGYNPFTTVQNPVGSQELAAAEASYNLVLTSAVLVFRQPTCKKGEKPSVQNICTPLSVKKQIQVYGRQAHVAMLELRNFVQQNPNVSAVTLLANARKAIANFKAATEKKS